MWLVNMDNVADMVTSLNLSMATLWSFDALACEVSLISVIAVNIAILEADVFNKLKRDF